MFKRAYRENMLYKVRRYGEMQERAEFLAAQEEQVIRVKRPRLKAAAGLDPDDRADNWSIFDSISASYREARDRASQFEAIKERAQERVRGGMAFDHVLERDDPAHGYRDELVAALECLSNFAAQAHIVERVVDMVASFLKNPRLFQRRMMNLIFMGGAGTGKSMISAAIGEVFARAGMFVGDKLVDAGRAELVGQYEGQTVARTRNFLVSNLDAGVIFIDEAYAITPWHNAKPEGYGSEATTAMVEFMTRYQGLYCIILAGYEREMTRYFLPTNEGLGRRFPYKFVLRDMSAAQLVHVFKRKLQEMQGLPVPHDGDPAPLESESYFSPEAYGYLERVVHHARQGRVQYVVEDDPATNRRYENVRHFHPRWPLLYDVFQTQAGAMELLAYDALTVLMTTVTFEDAARRRAPRVGVPGAGGGVFRRQGVCAMRAVVVHRIQAVALSETERLEEPPTSSASPPGG